LPRYHSFEFRHHRARWEDTQKMDLSNGDDPGYAIFESPFRARLGTTSAKVRVCPGVSLCVQGVFRLANQKNWPIRSQHFGKNIHNPLFEVRGGGVLDDLSRGALLLAAPSLLCLARSLYAPHPLVFRRLHCTRLTPAMDLDTL
jgi:hypothetical protein